MQAPGCIKRNVSLAHYSTLGVGGPADYFAKIHNESELVETYEFTRSQSLDIFTLGRGSNVLFGDLGFRGLVMKINLTKFREYLWVEAGAQVSYLVKLACSGTAGYSSFAGLPGTVGGAVYGNAGCYGGAFWDVVAAVRFFDGENFIDWRANSQLHRYRGSVFKDNPKWIIVAAKLKLLPRDSEVVIAETDQILKRRRTSQPKERSVGCFFRNPVVNKKSVSAGKLIEEAGLKGLTVGRAQISRVHANFFVNLGGATAADFMELIKVVRGRVLERTGILLQEEIIRVGEF